MLDDYDRCFDPTRDWLSEFLLPPLIEACNLVLLIASARPPTGGEAGYGWLATRPDIEPDVFKLAPLKSADVREWMVGLGLHPDPGMARLLVVSHRGMPNHIGTQLSAYRDNGGTGHP